MYLYFFSKANIEFVIFRYYVYTIFVAKITFTDQSHLFAFLSSFFSCLYWCQEICCCKIFGNHAGIIAILSYYDSPGYRIFRKVSHATLYNLMIWSQENLNKHCKMCLPYFFLLFFLWLWLSKKLSNVTVSVTVSVSKVIKVEAWIFRQFSA